MEDPGPSDVVPHADEHVRSGAPEVSARGSSPDEVAVGVKLEDAISDGKAQPPQADAAPPCDVAGVPKDRIVDKLCDYTIRHLAFPNIRDCNRGDQCTHVHPPLIAPNGKKTNRLCAFLFCPRGCIKGQNCDFLHPIGRMSPLLHAELRYVLARMVAPVSVNPAGALGPAGSTGPTALGVGMVGGGASGALAHLASHQHADTSCPPAAVLAGASVSPSHWQVLTCPHPYAHGQVHAPPHGLAYLPEHPGYGGHLRLAGPGPTIVKRAFPQVVVSPTATTAFAASGGVVPISSSGNSNDAGGKHLSQAHAIRGSGGSPVGTAVEAQADKASFSKGDDVIAVDVAAEGSAVDVDSVPTGAMSCLPSADTSFIPAGSAATMSTSTVRLFQARSPLSSASARAPRRALPDQVQAAGACAVGKTPKTVSPTDCLSPADSASGPAFYTTGGLTVAASTAAAGSSARISCTGPIDPFISSLESFGAEATASTVSRHPSALSEPGNESFDRALLSPSAASVTLTLVASSPAGGLDRWQRQQQQQQGHPLPQTHARPHQQHSAASLPAGSRSAMLSHRDRIIPPGTVHVSPPVPVPGAPLQQIAAAYVNGQRVCSFHLGKRGCTKGDGCSFAHVIPSEGDRLFYANNPQPRVPQPGKVSSTTGSTAPSMGSASSVSFNGGAGVDAGLAGPAGPAFAIPARPMQQQVVAVAPGSAETLQHFQQQQHHQKHGGYPILWSAGYPQQQPHGASVTGDHAHPLQHQQQQQQQQRQQQHAPQMVAVRQRANSQGGGAGWGHAHEGVAVWAYGAPYLTSPHPQMQYAIMHPQQQQQELELHHHHLQHPGQSQGIWQQQPQTQQGQGPLPASTHAGAASHTQAYHALGSVGSASPHAGPRVADSVSSASVDTGYAPSGVSAEAAAAAPAAHADAGGRAAAGASAGVGMRLVHATAGFQHGHPQQQPPSAPSRPHRQQQLTGVTGTHGQARAVTPTARVHPPTGSHTRSSNHKSSQHEQQDPPQHGSHAHAASHPHQQPHHRARHSGRHSRSIDFAVEGPLMASPATDGAFPHATAVTPVGPATGHGHACGGPIQYVTGQVAYGPSGAYFINGPFYLAPGASGGAGEASTVQMTVTSPGSAFDSTSVSGAGGAASAVGAGGAGDGADSADDDVVSTGSSASGSHGDAPASSSVIVSAYAGAAGAGGVGAGLEDTPTMVALVPTGQYVQYGYSQYHPSAGYAQAQPAAGHYVASPYHGPHGYAGPVMVLRPQSAAGMRGERPNLQHTRTQYHPLSQPHSHHLHAHQHAQDLPHVQHPVHHPDLLASDAASVGSVESGPAGAGTPGHQRDTGTAVQFGDMHHHHKGAPSQPQQQHQHNQQLYQQFVSPHFNTHQPSERGTPRQQCHPRTPVNSKPPFPVAAGPAPVVANSAAEVPVLNQQQQSRDARSEVASTGSRRGPLSPFSVGAKFPLQSQISPRLSYPQQQQQGRPGVTKQHSAPRSSVARAPMSASTDSQH